MSGGRVHPRPKTRAWDKIRRKVLERDGYRCRECGRAGRLEVDHVRPVHLGGSHSMDNLQTLCVSDHIAKTRSENVQRRSAKDKIEWLNYLNGRSEHVI